MYGLPAIQKFLVLFLVLGVTLTAGQDTAQPKLNILIIGGEGSINNVKQRIAREPIVQVTDENDRPVAGAVVLFRLPNSGPSGTFLANQSNVISITTGADGRAAARFMPNESVGDFQIQVSATHQGRTASTAINMSNASGAPTPLAKAAGGGAGKIIAIVAAIGAAAAVGVVAGTRGGNGNGQTPPPASPTTITAGTGSVGQRP